MQRWIVICLVTDEFDLEFVSEHRSGKQHYCLATRIAFNTLESAERYANTIHESRKAIVVECLLGLEFRDDCRVARFRSNAVCRT